MKKIYMSLAFIGALLTSQAQDAFWTPTTYRGAFPVTDGTPATDWTSGWANFDAQNTVYPATVTTVSTDVTASTTWSGVILLQNKVFVKNNATLTIAPGTIIRGDYATQGTLIITRGAKIVANGTVANPIVFTSNLAPGNRNEGDWGGLVILGLAKNNQPGGIANIEGIPPSTDTQFGGNFDNDNSGSLQYVRVEFSGIPLEPNKELNGITFGSVGSGTVVDYVQVSHCGDDSFEWFGGTVNCKHLIAYGGLDDDFDCDFGFRGKVQFALSIRDKDLSDAPGDSNAFECDNDATGSTAQPKTRPIFSNVTLVGPKGNGSIALPVGEKFEKAFRLRRNSSVSVLNSLVTGWEKGLSIEGAPVVANMNGDSMVFVNNILTNFATPTWSSNNTNTVYNSGGANGTWYNSWWGLDGNDSTQTLAQVNWVNIFTALGTTPDARLNAGSVAATGATFTNPKFFSVAAPVVANVTYCQGANAVALTATTTGGNAAYWYTAPSGGVGSMVAPIPSTSAAGTFNFYVSQKNAAGDESPRVMITVTVNALPATPIITANGSTSLCTGSSVVLSSSYNNGNVWSTSATTQTISVNSTGAYTVTHTDANGCSSTSTTTIVNVSAAPAPTVQASAVEACIGDTVMLTASASDSYVWSTGDTTQSIMVTSTTNNITVTTTNAIACNGVGSSTPISITFNAAPTAAGSFTTNGNVVTFANTSTGATSYSWDFGDMTNSSAAAPLHAYAANGTYTVTLTAINGNCEDVTTLTVNIAVSLDEMPGVSLNLAPNPATTTFTVMLNGASLEQVTLIDGFGRTVATSNAAVLSLEGIANGVYHVMVQTNQGNAIRKLVVNQ
ncbi:MAG: PKD domain-containing protein [Bacteroidetes bacterium]|nr:PKD domain-containing protein [Bacteroidota bacterium]